MSLTTSPRFPLTFTPRSTHRSPVVLVWLVVRTTFIGYPQLAASRNSMPSSPRAPQLGNRDNMRLTVTTVGCHTVRMPQSPDVSAHQETFQRLKETRAEALEHARLARQLAAERRDVIRGLIAEGFSQADIARELGVTRQAIQKMLAC